MLKSGIPQASHGDILKIVLVYAVFAALWILLSDSTIDWLFNTPGTYFQTAQTLKGWLFVCVTSLLLYLLLNRLTRNNAPPRHSGLVNWSRWQLYLFAVSLSLVVLLIRQSLATSSGEPPLVILFMFPIILSAALGGFGPGLLATLISVLSVGYFASAPAGSFRPYELLQLGFLAAEGLLVSFLSMMMHEARHRSETERQKAESSLDEKTRALQLLYSITEGSTDSIFAKDVQGRYTLFNRASSQVVGKPVEEVLGKDDTALFGEEDALVVMADDRRVMSDGKVITFEHTLATARGTRTFLTTQGPMRDAADKVMGVFGIARDITERKEAEAQLLKLSLAVEQSPENIAITDLAAKIEYVNEAFVRNSGYSREELIGHNPRIHQSGKTPKSTYAELWHQLTAGKTWQGELYNRRKDGSEYTVHAIISPIHQADGRITHYVAVEQDITEQKRAESEIHRLAFYDTLTGLPNRALLLDRIGMVLPIAQRQRRHDGLILFNVDRFKNVNDASGQVVGDSLLKAVAERLGKVLREGDVLARLSGDEFAILLPDLARQQHAAAHQTIHVAEKLHICLRQPFQIDEEQISLTASIGIALFPTADSDSSLDILRRANTALHQSKAAGGSVTTLFEHSMDEKAKQRFRIERELTLAIPAGQLRLYLQPQVDASGRTVGAEALVRWQHPELGLVPPGLFIPVAEESELIIEIGRWVFRQVCQLLTRETLHGQPFRIAVNISARQFRQPDFVAWIRDELAVCGAEPTHLTLEVTEGVVIDDINSVIVKMNELSLMGIHFSLDDFGTGYSSLAYLKRLPIHELKIDKIFVQDAPSDPDDAALVETILAVAKHMHLKVVAEGVETEEQAAFLNQRGQVIHQGYLFGRPEPAETVLAGLADKR